MRLPTIIFGSGIVRCKRERVIWGTGILGIREHASEYCGSSGFNEGAQSLLTKSPCMHGVMRLLLAMKREFVTVGERTSPWRSHTNMLTPTNHKVTYTNPFTLHSLLLAAVYGRFQRGKSPTSRNASKTVPHHFVSRALFYLSFHHYPKISGGNTHPQDSSHDPEP